MAERFYFIEFKVHPKETEAHSPRSGCRSSQGSGSARASTVDKWKSKREGSCHRPRQRSCSGCIFESCGNFTRSLASLAIKNGSYLTVSIPSHGSCENKLVSGSRLSSRNGPEHLPDLIVSNILMPEGDRTTLFRDIRRDPKLKFTQIVLMTGSPDLAASCKGVEELVADDFLVKPVDLQTLLSSVQARVRSCLPPSVFARL